MTEAMQEVLSDHYLGNWIGYYAHKMSRRFPTTMGREDAKQVLWEAIVKAMNAYNGEKTPIDHARSAAYSKYGSMISGRLKKLPFHEKMSTGDFEDTTRTVAGKNDDIRRIEANDSLDRIEKLLQQESERGKTSTLALGWLRLMRKGYTVDESARKLGVTANYLYQIRHRVFHRDDVRKLACMP